MNYLWSLMLEIYLVDSFRGLQLLLLPFRWHRFICLMSLPLILMSNKGLKQVKVVRSLLTPTRYVVIVDHAKITSKFPHSVKHLLHQKIRRPYMHHRFVSDVLKALQINQFMDHKEVANLSDSEL